MEKQHAKGKLTARERIDLLLDEGSFAELDQYSRHRSTAFGMEKKRPYGDGVVVGTGSINGRPVCVFSQDVAIFGGSLGQVYGEKIVKIIDFALKTGVPADRPERGWRRPDPGGRGVPGSVRRDLPTQYPGLRGDPADLDDHGRGRRRTRVLPPALTDFVVMVDQTSQMFITGPPEVIKTVTGEDVSMEELGGGRTHNTKSGNAHYLAADEQDAIDYVRDLISFLPQNNLEDPPIFDEEADLSITEHDRSLDTLIPDSPNQPYDVKKIVEVVLDDEDFLEVSELFAPPNIVTGFGRVEGRSVGIVANQPMHFAGCLDIDASEKAARFVRTCDAFNIPILTFVDVPGFLPGVEQEHQASSAAGAKLIYAYAEATVPLITVITRKAYGGAYDVMASKHLAPTSTWPGRPPRSR